MCCKGMFEENEQEKEKEKEKVREKIELFCVR